MGFAVYLDANVAVFLGFGGGDHALGGFEAAQGGDLWFGGSFGSFGSFGDFDHFGVFLLCLQFFLTKEIPITVCHRIDPLVFGKR